jgi:GT2 family glycosyltransferase
VDACEGLEIYENGKILETGSLFSTPLIDFYELSLIGKRIADKPMIAGYRLATNDRKKDFDVDVACDAFLLVRKKVLDKLKGYDEKFLLYYTENDLCLRIKKMGKRVVHLGDVTVIHRVSASVVNLGWRKTDIYYHDLFHYYWKHGYKFSGTGLFCLLKFEEFLLQVRAKIKSTNE